MPETTDILALIQAAVTIHLYLLVTHRHLVFMVLLHRKCKEQHTVITNIKN